MERSPPVTDKLGVLNKKHKKGCNQFLRDYNGSGRNENCV
jgi:hypothetical protein